MTAAATIARLAITLDDVTPPVRRTIEVPLAIRLDQLHRVFQIAMGWEDYHLWEFRVGRSIRYGLPDPDYDLPETKARPARKATLADLLADARNKGFAYIYDFGDDWGHTVKLQALVEPAPDAVYPRLVAAQGCCPPEDVGGPWGYAAYLEALADPEHENHAEMVEWRGPDFDPDQVDPVAINKALVAYAKRIRPKRAAP